MIWLLVFLFLMMMVIFKSNKQSYLLLLAVCFIIPFLQMFSLARRIGSSRCLRIVPSTAIFQRGFANAKQPVVEGRQRLELLEEKASYNSICYFYA